MLTKEKDKSRGDVFNIAKARFDGIINGGRREKLKCSFRYIAWAGKEERERHFRVSVAKHRGTSSAGCIHGQRQRTVILL